MVSDTVYTYLRNAQPPYEVADIAMGVADPNGQSTFEFSNAVNGSDYYLQIEHRNTLQTWSSLPQQFAGYSLTFDFTSAQSQAFGSNMILADDSPVTYAFYSGDVDQDGTIDASDLSMIDNDATAFVTGYVVTDITGDNFVDGSDYSIADNNASQFISAILP